MRFNQQNIEISTQVGVISNRLNTAQKERPGRNKLTDLIKL